VSSMSKEQVSTVLKQQRIATIPKDWTGVSPVWPAFERMADEGAVIVIKIDGLRGSSDTGKYTVVINGGPLGEDFFRLDTSNLDEGLALGILFYSSRCWQ